MRVRATTFLGSEEYPAAVSRRHPRSCFGQAVLVVMSPEGGAVGPLEAAFAGYEILDATEEQRRLLVEAGYQLKGLDGVRPLAAVGDDEDRPSAFD